MHKLRAQTLMAESRARQAQGDLILDVVVAIREPGEVTALGRGRATVLSITPKRPWWRSLGLRTHRIHRRARNVSSGRAVRVEVQGLQKAYLLWAVVAYWLVYAAVCYLALLAQ